MPYETLTGGLGLVIPTNGTRNWGTVLKNSTWTKINTHTHTGSGDGDQLTAGSYSNNSVGKAALALNLGLHQAATLTPSGTTETIDWNLGNKQRLDLSSATGTVTLTLNNPIEGADYRIKIVQGGTVRAITWPASVKWPQGEEPTQFHQTSTENMVYLDYDGTNYYAKWELDYS